jgi:putative sigma-54 modulation protein
MKINITGRHFDVSDDLSKYAEKKLIRLEKFFHKPASINIIMYLEKHNHIIEAVVEGDGNQFHATEKANDMYSTIDQMMKSLEKQIVKNKEKHTGHKATPLSETISTESATDEIAGLVINHTGNKPKDAIEAYLEMKVDNQDFILFKNHIETKGNNNHSHAVIYKTDEGYKMAELSKKKSESKKRKNNGIAEFNLIIRNDSMHKPKIKFKKCGNSVKEMDVNSAVRELLQKGDFLPFYNNETEFLNVIFKNKNNIELLTPVI